MSNTPDIQKKSVCVCVYTREFFSYTKCHVLSVCLAHIRGRKHKKKVASLRKQAQKLSASTETDNTSLMTDCLVNDRNADEVMSD